MLENYRTIKADGQFEIEIKKSRFLCTLKRVTTEEEAKIFIQEIKKEHWKATHNCSAFLIGEKNEVQRSSDDGEPSGTAGIPMLEVLKKNELTNVAAVVTRYFGGIKLGAGGLIRAYAGAVSATLEHIGIVEGKLQREVLVRVSYPLLNKLQYFLEQNHYTTTDSQFLEEVTLTVLVDDASMNDFEQKITEVLNGQVIFEKGSYSYLEVPIS